MKSRLLLAALLFCSCAAIAQVAPGVATTTPNPEYPLHLRILSSQRSNNRFGVHGFGHGDLIDAQIRGFDYTFDCSVGFLHNEHPDEFYMGRWKKPDQKIEIMVQKVGSTHVDKCDINVAMKPEPYGKYPKSMTQPPPAAAPVP